MVENLVIYYFSGTGNAKAVSNWIAETFQENSIPTQIIELNHYGLKIHRFLKQ